MTPIVFPLPGGEALAADLATLAGWELGRTGFRRFPDGEASFRLDPLPSQRTAILAGALDDPDPKTVALLLMAATARELGGAPVLLVAPYLAYMRQDISFRAGEPVSARHYARLLSGAVDALVTVDPHLHRIHRLEEIYSIPTRVVSAAPLLAAWIKAEVADPFVVGPDEESIQWVRKVAEAAGAPWTVMRKRRLGDRKVQVEAPDLADFAGRAPVLVDDIVSSGRTLIESAARLSEQGFRPGHCVIVHDLTSAEARDAVAEAGLSLVSVDTVPNPSNALRAAPLLLPAIGELLAL